MNPLKYGHSLSPFTIPFLNHRYYIGGFCLPLCGDREREKSEKIEKEFVAAFFVVLLHNLTPQFSGNTNGGDKDCGMITSSKNIDYEEINSGEALRTNFLDTLGHVDFVKIHKLS